MLIGDVMTTDLVTVTSTAPLSDMRGLMDTRRVRRLPVVENGELVGLVTRNALEREFSSLLSTLAAKDIMVTNLVTTSPDATVEEGVALAQARRVGALLVVKDDRLVGIATTNDFFYKLLNPILGIGLPGVRLSVSNFSGAPDLENILHITNKLGLDVITMFTMTRPDTGQRLFTLHLDTDEPSVVLAELRKHGYEVEARAR
ncbi:MAG: CBS domain-containing protein [Chloroflexota bacterium]